MPAQKPKNFIVLGLFLLISLGVVGFAIFSLSKKSELDPFPDEVYLNAPLSLSGEVNFEGRVVSLLGRSAERSTIRFSVLKSQSGQPLDLVVVVPNSLKPESLISGQVYRLKTRGEKGNLILEDLEKY